MTRADTTPRAARRRRRFVVLSAVLLSSLTLACGFAFVIARTLSVRVDTTALGAHSLSPSTRAVLDRLDTRADLVVLGATSRLPSDARRAMLDTLDAMDAASPNLDVQRIDPLAPGAAARAEAVVARMLDRQPARAADHERRLTLARDRALTLASALRVQRDIRPDAAGALEILADEIETAAESLDAAATITSGGLAIPSLPRAKQALASPLSRTRGILGSVPTPDAEELLEGLASIDEALDGADPLNAAAAAELLAGAESVIVATDRRLAAIAYEDLFQPSDTTGEPRFAGEDLLASAVTSVRTDRRPVVVFVHGEATNVLDASGEPSQPARAVFGDLLARFDLRQFRLGEWAPALEQPMPSRAQLGADLDDPVVWFVLGPPRAGTPDASRRLIALGDALTRLIGLGESVLVSLTPSDLPALGQADPLAEPLRPVGIVADTGRVVINRRTTPTGPMFDAVRVTSAGSDDHPLGRLIDGLSLQLRLPTAMRFEDISTPSRTVSGWPIVSIPDADDTWAEQQWQTLGSPRGALNPPSADPREDVTAGPYTVVGAAQVLSNEPGAPPQRVVVVGGWLWFHNETTLATTTLNGRRVERFPANAELAQAAVLWLAGQEELIARGAETAHTPRIRAIDPTRLAALRWSLVVGMPLCVLLAGAVVSLKRR